METDHSKFEALNKTKNDLLMEIELAAKKEYNVVTTDPKKLVKEQNILMQKLQEVRGEAAMIIKR